MPIKSLIERDKEVIWHPYTPLAGEAPLAVSSARGELITIESGKTLVDMISSWWVNIHGHNHPHIAERIREQLETLDHVLFAGFTHQPAVELAERLLTHLPAGQRRIFYSDNGSTAVEVAIKMAVQYWANGGEPRERVAVISGSYHGDTVGAMSVSERGIFTLPFKKLLFEIDELPRPSPDDEEFLTAVERIARDGGLAAFIYEPLVQGAGGMYMYDAHLLDRALQIFKRHGVICIADEVMTGFGRTGKWFASDYAEEKPDIVCVSKGITGGVLPLGVTSCSEKIEKSFMSDDRSRTFFHGHSYTANPIACAAACASLDLLEDSNCWKSIERIARSHVEAIPRLAHLPNTAHVRARGTILALDVVAKGSGYLSPLAPKLYRSFIERGFLIRPLGNVIYLMPPYCVSDENLRGAYDAIAAAVESV